LRLDRAGNGGTKCELSAQLVRDRFRRAFIICGKHDHFDALTHCAATASLASALSVSATAITPTSSPDLVQRVEQCEGRVT
jgi:hypothetical protein